MVDYEIDIHYQEWVSNVETVLQSVSFQASPLMVGGSTVNRELTKQLLGLISD